MNPEIIAILNARSPDMRMLPRGHGSLNQIDIAHAIGRVKGYGPRLIGHVLCAEHGQFAADLAGCLYRHLLSHARLFRWKNTKPLYSLAKLSVALYCYPKRCRKCKGIGKRHIASKVYICARCNGSTWDSEKPAILARLLGVSKPAFAETWEPRLKDSLAILGGMERHLLIDLSKILS